MSTLNNQRQLQQQLGHSVGGFTRDFAVVDMILRDRQTFFEQIRQGVGLPEKIMAMLISSIAFLAVYGAVLGSTHSVWQSLSSALKLPLLFLGTMLICIPTLYVFSVLFGSNQRLSQSLALVLSAITMMAVLLLSFASITLFFMLTTSDYQFFKLFNVFIFIITGLIGMMFLLRGMDVVSMIDQDQGRWGRSLVLYAWILLYGFVGSQVAWTLRPFVGYPDAKFELIRQVGGNFYTDIFSSLGELLGFFIVL